jgi:hypothetical protein
VVVAVVVGAVVALVVAALGGLLLREPPLPPVLSPLSAPRSLVALGLLVGVTLLVACLLGLGAQGGEGMLVLIVAVTLVALGAAAGWAAYRLRTSP